MSSLSDQLFRLQRVVIVCCLFSCIVSAFKCTHLHDTRKCHCATSQFIDEDEASENSRKESEEYEREIQ